jgi:hypothetical protein
MSEYAELTESLRKRYAESQRQYSMAHLQAKMRCYEVPALRLRYYDCVEGVEQLMLSNSARLKADI